MFACNRCEIKPVKSRFEIVRHCEEQHGGFGYWCTVCKHPYTRLGKHSRCKALTTQMVTYHRQSGITGPQAQVILEEFGRMWRAIPYSHEDYINNAPIPQPVLPPVYDVTPRNPVPTPILTSLTRPPKRIDSIIPKPVKPAQPALASEQYIDEFTTSNDPEIHLMEPDIPDLTEVHFDPPVRSYSPTGRFSPHLSISSSNCSSRTGSRSSSTSSSGNSGSRSVSSCSRSSSRSRPPKRKTKRHKTDPTPDDRVINMKRKLPPIQHTETKVAKIENQKPIMSKEYGQKHEPKMTQQKSNEQRARASEIPKVTHVTEKKKLNREETVTKEKDGNEKKMRIEVTIGKESERKVKSKENSKLHENERKDENRDKEKHKNDKTIHKKSSEVHENERKDENRDKEKPKNDKTIHKKSSEVHENERKDENRDKEKPKNDKTIHKKSSEIHENERKDENGEKNESKIGKESENMKNKSTENKSEKTTSQNLNGDSDDEFEVPEEEAVEWFAKNWSHNVFYNLSRGVTTLHYKGSTRPVERHETHQPLSNIAYKQFTILQEIQESRINLIVGGQEFKTSKVTLLSDPDSLLGMLFRRSCPMRPVNGNTYIFDRNPKYFGYILDFLRNGGHIDLMILPGEKSELLALLTEARYFMVKGLEKIILDRCQVEFNSRLY